MDDLMAERIRALDDHLQNNPTSDIAIMTPGIAALGQEAADRIIKTITASRSNWPPLGKPSTPKPSRPKPIWSASNGTSTMPNANST
jgi:hypothetical protein